MKEIELIKKLRNRTLERALEKHGHITGDLREMKLSISDLREILYDQTTKLAEEIVREDLK